MGPLIHNTSYRRLFAAQVVALLGTGLMSVALGLLAFDLAGDAAGLVLGGAFTIKMIAYVGLSPVAHALVAHLPRKAVMVGADLVRAAAALCLPFVDTVWQVYALIFVLQAASATFSPAYQATLPELLPEEADYTRALSLSRLAYELESLASPALAGLLLLLLSFSALFAGTGIGFGLSAALVLSVRLPARTPAAAAQGFRDRLTRGIRLYLATPRLRGLLAVTFAAASVGAFVLVNTVVLVRAGYGAGEGALAWAMATFGAGAMVAALALPPWLDTRPDRPVMLWAAGLCGGLAVAAGLLLMVGLPPAPVGLALLFLGGLTYSATLTPSGRLIKRSSGDGDRPALFVAHFALSHACWLVTYPLAGWAGAHFGLGGTLAGLGVLALMASQTARRVWPVRDPAG